MDFISFRNIVEEPVYIAFMEPRRVDQKSRSLSFFICFLIIIFFVYSPQELVAQDDLDPLSIIDVKSKAEVGTVIRYVSELPKPYVSEYVELDLRFGYKINKTFSLDIVGQNLLQKSHAEFIPSSPAPKHIERSMYVKLHCRL